MAKGWILVGNNDLSSGKFETREEKSRRERRFKKAINNIKPLSLEEMQEHSEKAFENKKNNDNNLLQAFRDKKLKSKSLIKKAKELEKKSKKNNNN